MYGSLFNSKIPARSAPSPKIFTFNSETAFHRALLLHRRPQPCRQSPHKYRHWQHFYFSSSAFLCELCVSGLSSPTAQLVFGAAVQIFVAIRTQGNQISHRVVPEPTTGDYVVDMQIVSPATELAPPPVSFEHLIVKRLILGPRELQSLHFAMNFTHEFPWAPDGFRRLLAVVSRLIFWAVALMWRPRENRRRSFRGSSLGICRCPTSALPSQGLSRRPVTDSCEP